MTRRTAIFFVALSLAAAPAVAAEALVAVAANFAGAMTELEAAFERGGTHRLRVSTGATGTLYAQATHGAPYDILMAADRVRPERLETVGLAVPGSRRTYAVGRLVLWSAEPNRVSENGVDTLRAGDFRRLAIANPELAPYGSAARDVLRGLGLYDPLRDRIVMGENIGQAHAMVATGSAELGFVALSQLTGPDGEPAGSRWPVPETLHAPIRQDLVLLHRGTANAAARAFLDFLETAAARRILVAAGYRVPPVRPSGDAR
ncbi:MAG: molybdate ABC transporter substrate-binding protein [Gammaproteobacteria bacterium]|nr:molybdate ABC transporter substrate-binding protein [Gammaproteobacteria bacterium]